MCSPVCTADSPGLPCSHRRRATPWCTSGTLTITEHTPGKQVVDLVAQRSQFFCLLRRIEEIDQRNIRSVYVSGQFLLPYRVRLVNSCYVLSKQFDLSRCLGL